MKIATTLLPRAGQSFCDRITANDLAVVIDVLRATSVMCTALDNGAQGVMTCREVAQAKSLAERLTPRPLLCGERGCKPIPGFDLGNSPSEYTGKRVRDQMLVLTTTNGTRAIEYASRAGEILAGCFLNLSCVVERLANRKSVHLVCAGTEGEITVEDVLFAGALIARCETRYGAELQDDDSLLARQLWMSWFPTARDANAESLARRLRETRGGRNLLRVGYEDDLARCAAIDSVRAVPNRIGNDPIAFEFRERGVLGGAGVVSD